MLYRSKTPDAAGGARDLGGGPRATAAAAAGPTELVLDLDERRRQHRLRVRYEHRQLRSATAGVLEVRYRSARIPPGCLHRGELATIAPQRLAFCYATMAEVVRWRYVELRQREEVRVELAASPVTP